MSSQNKPLLFGSPVITNGSTDPISNTVVLPGLDAIQVVRDIESKPLPAEFLPVFLHEATHHICFFTPVGRSLASLAISAAGETSPTKATDETFRMRQNDVLKYYCFLEFIRPLAEGLALFAQFDAYPGDSPLISDPVKKVSYLFVPPKKRRLVKSGQENEIFDICKSILFDVRSQPCSIDSKSYLLSLGVPHNDEGYLLGYLFVKGLRLQLIPKCLRLRDGDLFLSFMISYWFGDALFAELLIKDTGVVDEDIKRVFSYIQCRIEYLTANISRFVAEFENLPPPADYLEKRRLPSYCNRKHFDEVLQLIQQELRVVGKYDVFNWDLLGNRPAFRFAASSAKVEVMCDRMIIVRDEKSQQKVIIGKALKAIPGSRVTSGSVEAALLPDGKIIICIFHDKELVSTVSLPDGICNEESLLGLGDTMLPYLEVEKLLIEIEEQRKIYRTELGNSLKRRVAEASAAAFETYAAVGLMDVEEKCNFQRISLLHKSGFLTIFDMDKGLLNTASAVSLIAGHGFHFTKLASLLNMPESKFRAKFHLIEEVCLSKLNVKPFLVVRDQLLGSLL